MRAEKGGNNVEWLFLMQFAEKPQSGELMPYVEAVATLGVDRRRAMGGKLEKRGQRLAFQVLRLCPAEGAHGREDSSATPGDLPVRRALNSLLIFRNPAGGKNQMRVRVNQARQNNTRTEV
jgi:hypothetical protein